MGREASRGQGEGSRGPHPLSGPEATGWPRTGLRAVGAAVLVMSKVATAAYTVEAVVHPHQAKYKGKGMRIRALGYSGGLGLVPAWWWLHGRQAGYPVAADLAVTVPLLIDAGGNSRGIYDAARLDDLVHGVNTAVLSSLFGAVISPHLGSRAVAVASTVAFGVVGELGWEVMEYAAERIGFQGLGLSHRDTTADIVVASLGAVVAGAVTWVRWQPSKQEPLRNLP